MTLGQRRPCAFSSDRALVVGFASAGLFLKQLPLGGVLAYHRGRLTVQPEDHGSIVQWGTGGANRRSGFGVCAGSQISTRIHCSAPSGTGAHVEKGLKRDAVKARARGEWVVRTDTGTDTERLSPSKASMATAS